MDELQEALSSGLRRVEQSLKGVFEEMVSAVDTAVASHNELETKQARLEQAQADLRKTVHRLEAMLLDLQRRIP
jgi:peptidoglycan hydrolase CwlO-like protein